MNGTWKNDIGGYNHKGQRRKTQNRKQHLKDTIVWHAKYKNKKSSIYSEGDIETQNKPAVYKDSGFHKVAIIEVSNYCGTKYNIELEYDTEIYSSSIKTAFEYNGSWYDFYNDIKIDGVCKVLKIIDTCEVKYPEPLLIKRKEYCQASSITHDFIHNKPLPEKYYKIFGMYNSSKRWAKKYASSLDRAVVRDYISNGDFEKEIKTHAYSKSIACLIW